MPKCTVLLLVFALGSSTANADQAEQNSSAAILQPTAKQINKSIRRGVDFLLEDQNTNGSWGTAQKTKDLNIYAPIPGAHHAFRTAVTSLCISALIETGDDRQVVKKSIQRAEAWLFDYLPKLRRATPKAIYNIWAHGYSIQALVRLHQYQGSQKKRRQIIKLIQQQFDFLERYESVDGGWGYYDFRVGTKKPASSSISFISATILIAMHEAQEIGLKPPKALVDRAIAAIKRQRKSDFTYLYGEYLRLRPMRGINRPGGSLGRSQVCNLALRKWGDSKITDDVLDTWLNRLFLRNGWLDMGRKRPVPHESWMQVAGYFYYYGHYYAAYCIEQLPLDKQVAFRSQMASLMLAKQEKNGSWFDYPLYNYGHPYGTAFALMALQRSRPVNSVPPDSLP